MALLEGQDAPWYETKNLIRCPHETLGFEYVIANYQLIPLSFTFSIGSNTIKYITVNWGSIYLYPDNVRETSSSSYTPRCWCVNIGGYGWVGEKISYESTSKYVRIRYDINRAGYSGKKEYIFFSNGDMQCKQSYASSSYEKAAEIYYQTWSGSEWKNTYLIQDDSKLEANESVYLRRVNSSSYTLYRHSHYQNDSTYTIPLATNIIDEILMAGENVTVDSSSVPRLYRVPVYSSTGIGSYSKKVNIMSSTGAKGYIRTQSPVTPNAKNPPFYISPSGTKLQFSMGIGTAQAVYDGVELNGWGELSGNLSPPNTSTYYWIGWNQYRKFAQAISGVTGIAMRWGCDEGKNITNYVYLYTGASPTITSVTSLTYRSGAISNPTTYRYDGYSRITEWSFSSTTVGGVTLVPGISGTNASSCLFSIYDVYVKTANGWLQA